MPFLTTMANFYDEPTSTIQNLKDDEATELPTTTMSPLTTLSEIIFGGNPLMTTMSPSSHQQEHLEHKKISFEIPTHRDLEHIDTLHNFNTLLKRIGNVVTYDPSQLVGNNHFSSSSSLSPAADGLGVDLQQQQHLLTNADISKSVVLDLADLKANEGFGFDRFFAGADMHSIINYLWIGVVTSLVILSVIFIVFSCYFYRKFREWKKCNKDIRAHLNGNGNHSNSNHSESLLYPHGSGIIGATATGATTACLGQMTGGNDTATTTMAYYQMESPPCYTIATGLPSYDEALLHHHQHQQQHYLSYALRYMYPTLAAVHHQQHQHQQHQQQQTNVGHVNAIIADEHFVTNWKKASNVHGSSDKRNASIVATINDTSTAYGGGSGRGGGGGGDHKMLQYCTVDDNKTAKITKKYMQQQQQFLLQQHGEGEYLQQQQQQKIKVSTLSLLKQSARPTCDFAASVALLSGTESFALLDDPDDDGIVFNSNTNNNSNNNNNNKISNDINICIANDEEEEEDEEEEGKDVEVSVIGDKNASMMMPLGSEAENLNGIVVVVA